MFVSTVFFSASIRFSRLTTFVVVVAIALLSRARASSVYAERTEYKYDVRFKRRKTTTKNARKDANRQADTTTDHR